MLTKLFKRRTAAVPAIEIPKRVEPSVRMGEDGNEAMSAAQQKNPARRQKDLQYAVLATPGEIRSIAARKILICGHGQFATLDPNQRPPAAGFVEQLPRPAMSALKAMVAGKKATRLRVAVDGALLEAAKVRFAFALDGYISWGLKNSDKTTILFGGAESGGTTYLEVYVFQGKVLVQVGERRLPASDDSEFAESLRVVLDDLFVKYGQARVVASAPLPDWEFPDVAYLGQAPLKGLTYRPLSDKPGLTTEAKFCAALVVVALLAYTGQIGAGWVMYSKQGARYTAEAASPELGHAGGINNAQLDVMQQQRLFMEAKRPQDTLMAQSGRIVDAVAAIPGVQIRTLTFGAPPQASTQIADPPADGQPAPSAVAEPDVAMEIQLPADAGSAMQQAHLVMSGISSKTGLKMRLVAGGWDTNEGGTRTLRIEGFMK